VTTGAPENGITAQGRTVGERVRHELKEYALVAGYLYVCLGALLLYRYAIESETGASAVHFGTAAVKALILGKFVLLGQVAGVGTRGSTGTVLGRIAWKSVAFLLLLIVLTVIEEVVAGMIHGRSLGKALAELGSRSWLDIVASSLLLLLVLIPFFGAREVSAALGPGGLKRLLAGRGHPEEPSH
jgi:hypothetical protein